MRESEKSWAVMIEGQWGSWRSALHVTSLEAIVEAQGWLNDHPDIATATAGPKVTLVQRLRVVETQTFTLVP